MFLGPIFYIFRIFILKDDFYTSIRFDPRPKRGRKYGRHKAHARKHKPLCRSIMVPSQCSSREKLSPLLSPYQFLELSFMQGKLIFEAETKKINCCLNSFNFLNFLILFRKFLFFFLLLLCNFYFLGSKTCFVI